MTVAVEIDRNVAEDSIRAIVINCENALFAGSETAAGTAQPSLALQDKVSDHATQFSLNLKTIQSVNDKKLGINLLRIYDIRMYARLQLIGPSLAFLAAVAADAAARALAGHPGSQLRWYINLEWFGFFERAYESLPQYLGLPWVMVWLSVPPSYDGLGRIPRAEK